MRIVEVTQATVKARLAADVGNSRSRWTLREGHLLVLRDEAGHIGLGEASPLPGYSRGELGFSLYEVEFGFFGIRDALQQETFSEGIEGLAAIRERCAASTQLVSVAFGLETAVLDLIGQRLLKPVMELLGGTSRVSVPRCGLIASAPAEWVVAAKALDSRGVGTIKIKVGHPGAEAEEVAQLKAVRETLPKSTAIRLDANGAWDLDEARRRLESFASCGVEYVEQPVSPGRLVRLGECAVPWAADESLTDKEETDALLDGPCAAFVLKPAVLGGLAKCMDLARRAAARGIASVVSHVFDGPVALAACCELALALPGPVTACGIDLHAGLGIWPSVAIPQLRMEADIVRGAGRHVGLGFSNDDRERLASAGRRH